MPTKLSGRLRFYGVNTSISGPPVGWLGTTPPTNFHIIMWEEMSCSFWIFHWHNSAFARFSARIAQNSEFQIGMYARFIFSSHRTESLELACIQGRL